MSRAMTHGFREKGAALRAGRLWRAAPHNQRSCGAGLQTRRDGEAVPMLQKSKLCGIVAGRWCSRQKNLFPNAFARSGRSY